MVDMVDFGRVDASWGVFEGTLSSFKISRSLTLPLAAFKICIHHPSPDSLRKQIH